MLDTLVHVGPSGVTLDTLDYTRYPLIHTGYLGVAFSLLESVQKHQHSRKVFIKLTPLQRRPLYREA